MVIVPALAHTEDAEGQVVATLVPSVERAATPHVADRVNAERHMVNEEEPREPAPDEPGQSSTPCSRQHAAKSRGDEQAQNRPQGKQPADDAKQRIGKKIWEERYEDIRNFESYLDRNGIVVVKFFLNVSKAEQKRRFLARLDEPEKNWKFAAADVDERQHWRDYMKAYEDTIRETATPDSPWYVVPADNKWFSRLVVAGAMVDALANLGLRYPVVDDAKRKALAGARKRLEAE